MQYFAAFFVDALAVPQKDLQYGECLLGRPLLYLLSLMLFLYVACEVGMFNWLAKHLIAHGMAETAALNALSLGFATGLLAG